MLNNPAGPALILNTFIIGTALAVALILNQPLAILALFWIQPLPQLEYEDEQHGDTADDAEYSENGIGFGANLKK